MLGGVGWLAIKKRWLPNSRGDFDFAPTIDPKLGLQNYNWIISPVFFASCGW